MQYFFDSLIWRLIRMRLGNRLHNLALIEGTTNVENWLPGLSNLGREKRQQRESTQTN